VIQPIDRLDDPRIAPYARVGDPAWLRNHGLFVAEGRLVARRLFESHRFEVDSVLVTPAALAALQDILPEDVPAYVAEQALLNSITGFNFHRGCLALVRRPASADVLPSDVVSPLRGAHRLVALEGIGNPDNIGGIFRTAAAFGVDAVLLDPASGDPLYRKAIRTSMGAALQIPFARLEPWPEGLDLFKRDGFRIIALTPRADANHINEAAVTLPSRWVLLAGAEGPGLSDAALAAADVHARIPIAETVDSLNVTVAVGIALSRLRTA
jgi:tRNA G18 (ribose-2'-O)-methylase SpoU